MAMNLHVAHKQMKYVLYAGTVSCDCSMLYWHTDCSTHYNSGWRKQARKIASEFTGGSQVSLEPSVHSSHIHTVCRGGELLSVSYELPLDLLFPLKF